MGRVVHVVFFAVLAVTVMFFTGCGGGGGGPGGARDDSAISGNFTGMYLDIDDPSTTYGAGYFGVQADGAGTMSQDGDASDGDDAYDDETQPYQAYTDGTLIIGSVIQGAYNAAGDTAALADAEVSSSESLTLSMVVKDGSGMAASDFSGDYLAARFEVDTADSSKTTTLMNVTGNGDGTGSYTIVSDSDGSTGSGSLPSTMAPSGTGRFTVTTPGGDENGMLRSDGEFWLSVDTDGTDDTLGIMAGLRKGSGLSESTLSGTYTAVMVGDDSEGGWSAWTERLQVTADGAGNLTALVLEDSGDDEGSTYPMTYTVDSQGIISVGDTQMGIVSADGEMFVLADTAYDGTSDTEVFFMVGVKKQ
jgi:hypothetical protein